MDQLNVVVQHAPRFTLAEAESLAASRYGIAGRASALPSERDQNFTITSDAGAYVLKIANVTERREILDFQNAALAHLARHAPDLALPRVVPDLEGHLLADVAHGEQVHVVRLLTWVSGRVLAETRPHSRRLLSSLGRRLAEMDRALAGFRHPAMARPLQWDLARTNWVAGEFDRLRTAPRRRLVERVVARFEAHAQPVLRDLPRQVVHNDWNDYNVLVTGGAEGDATVTGVVDFGDMLESWPVADLAVACAYVMLGKPDPVAAAAAVVQGYHAVLPLSEAEREVLLDLIRARLAISVTMAACQSEQAPDNDYLRISERPAWHLVEQLDAIDPGWARCLFRHACGLPACSTAAGVKSWLERHTRSFASVADADLHSGPVTVLDLSVGSLDIPNLDNVTRLDRFSQLVDQQLSAKLELRGTPADGAGLSTGVGRSASFAAVGVGRYDEARLVYVSDLFHHENNWEAENRTVHIGIDLFLPAGSEIRAPLAGTVHSFRNNKGEGDYGPTILLEHAPEAGVHFFTLYGHLSEDSLTGLARGQQVAPGAVIARLGDVEVNGGWPPHLHFQVITDMLGREGDYPGVAAPSEREVWLSLCPDPNLILGIPADRFPAGSLDPDEILRLRARHLGRNLSVSYRRPLTMVRGHMQFLFDAEGRRFLDAVNNVPHVGHSHPRVVEAVSRQLAVLSTNTRYLHPLLAAYARRLAALLPDPLSVCFIVCSGSEANELALRLVRAATGRRDVIVVDGAYHGNTTSLIDISPYKFDGPGGGGRPTHVQKVRMPDVYRGPHRSATGASAGRRYAEDVAAAARAIAEEGRAVAAFFCESLLSCGGQIVLPDGYLTEAYRAVRAVGGLTIADEVQVGFGRVGTHFWGFETQGVVPDIVTLGKPIGNGFPLGAVVTRPEIAEAFANGMEYFNTFGGTQAACAAGQAVLDVMESEGLQARARHAGDRLKAGLRELLDRFAIIGDVRGLGLFLGIELVQDRETLVPAARQADYIVNRMRDRGILLSTDGPLHNIIKVKPPLQFSSADADRLVSTLAAVLEEDGARP